MEELIDGALAVEYLRAHWAGRVRTGMLRRSAIRDPWTLKQLRINILQLQDAMNVIASRSFDVALPQAKPLSGLVDVPSNDVLECVAAPNFLSTTPPPCRRL